MHLQVDVDALGVHHRCDGKDNERRQQALQGTRGDLLDGDERHRQRGQHAVLDLTRVAELLHHRQGHGLDALEHDRQTDHTGHEHRGERRLAGGAPAAPDALADGGEHVQEDEYQQEGLEDRAGQELLEVLPQHSEVAEQQPDEGALARLERRAAELGTLVARERGRRRRGRRSHQSRSSFPVRLMKTVSSVGSVTVRSTSCEPLWLTVSRTTGRASVAPLTRAARRRAPPRW